MRTSAALLLLVAGALLGCGRLRPGAGFDAVTDLVAARSPGREVVWNQGTAEDEAAVRQCRILLADELTLDAAVQIALLNNRALQAVYASSASPRPSSCRPGCCRTRSCPPTSASRGRGVGDRRRARPRAGADRDRCRSRSRSASPRRSSTRRSSPSPPPSRPGVDAKRTFYRLQGAEQTARAPPHRRRRRPRSRADVARRQHAAGNITDLALATEHALARGGARRARARRDARSPRTARS